MRNHLLACVLAICFSASLLGGPDKEPSVLDEKVAALDASGGFLADVVESLRDSSSNTIFVNWKALEKEGIDRSTPVTIDVKDAKIADVVKAINAALPNDKQKLACVEDDGIVYISTADDVKKFPAHDALPSRGDAQAAAKTSDALDRIIPEVNFNHIAARDVFEFLGDITKIKIEANWDALEKADFQKTTAVTARIKKLPLKRALRLILNDINGGVTGDSMADYVVDGDHILISTREDLLKK